MDKDGERRSFDEVYRSHDQWAITPSESPDFICLRDGKSVLGVEVTELWQHETDARLSRISGYVGSLLDGGEVAHKDDREVVKVEKVQLLPKDRLEPVAEVPAIVRKHPSPTECAKLLDAVLAVKESRINCYLSRCPHVDLLVDDQSMLFWFGQFEQLIRPFSNDPVRERVTSSGFREIFLLTYAEEGKRACVPLKASLLMEDLIVLEGLLSEEASALGEQLYSASGSSSIAISVLIAALSHLRGVRPAACLEEGRLGVSIGCMTLHWTSEGKVLRDYRSMPEQMVCAPDRLALTSDADCLARAIAERRSGHKATISFAFPLGAP